MKQRKIKYLKAYNILCFGPKGIEINFENLGNIVLVKGRNLDAINDENDAKDSSNGSGKSALVDVIAYTLYGKTIKKPKKFCHADVIHNMVDKKGLYTELIIDDYRIVRTRKLRKTTDTGTLDLWYSPEGIWDDKTKLSQGKSSSIQEKIIYEVIGLNYETFVNVFVFGDDNSSSFLECDAPTKREIVENLLSLEKYREYHENAKEFSKEIKDKIKLQMYEYNKFLVDLESSKNRIVKIETSELQWKQKKEKDIQNIISEIGILNYQLKNTDFDKKLQTYLISQEEIQKINCSLTETENKRDKLSNIINELENKNVKNSKDYENLKNRILELKMNVKKYEISIQENEEIIKDGGKKCSKCNSIIDADNKDILLNKIKNKIIEEKDVLENYSKELIILNSKFEEIINLKNKLTKGLEDGNIKLNSLNKEIKNSYLKINELSKIDKPNLNVEEAKLTEKINNLEVLLNNKKQENNPYIEILVAQKEELEIKNKEFIEKKKEIEELEKELPYYEFWIKAFGDNGIRKYIVEGIIPVLNSRIAYWLNCLMNGKVKLTFDNNLNETIDRYPFDGKKYAYHGLSNGQRRRLILSLSQSFAYVMMVSCGSSLSAIFLDEVTMNMDKIGVEAIYKMICELAKEKQVFVIDHNENLLNMFKGCKEIQLQMENGTTEIIN